MKDKFIKNLPYATTNCFILLLLYCSKYLNGITGGLYIVVYNTYSNEPAVIPKNEETLDHHIYNRCYY